MWNIIGAVIAGLVLLGVLIMSIPIGLAWRLSYYDRFKANIRWNWLWGWISRDIHTRKPSKVKRKVKRSSGFHLQNVLRSMRLAPEFWNNKGLVTCAIRFLDRVIHLVRFRKLEADLLVGTGDPAETSYLFFFTGPAGYLLDSFQHYPVNIRLSFSEPVLEGYFRGEIRLYPILFIPPVLRLIFSAPVLKLMVKAVSARWKRSS